MGIVGSTLSPTFSWRKKARELTFGLPKQTPRYKVHAACQRVAKLKLHNYLSSGPIKSQKLTPEQR